MTWGDVEVLDGRTCRRCKTWKPLHRFGTEGRDHVCKHCYYLDYTGGSRNGFGRARGIVITDLGRQTLRKMEAGSHA